MSETANALAPDAPSPAEPVAKSEVILPNDPTTGEPPKPDPAPEPPKPDAKSDEPAKKPWWEDRLAKQTRKIADGERRNEALLRELEELRSARKPPEGAPAEQASPAASTQADFDREVERRASARVEAERAQSQAADFNAECNRVFEAGKKDYPDFAEVLPTLWGAMDAIRSNGSLSPEAVSLIEAAIETGKPQQVLHHLGKNPDEAVRITGLPSEAKRAAAVVRLAASLDQPKQVSKTPPPLAPVGGQARNDPGETGPKDTGDFIKWFDERQKVRKGGK